MKPKKKKAHEPSDHERCQRIDQAIKAFADGSNIFLIAEKHNQLAMEFLQAHDMDEVLDWVAVFLQEIKEIGPAQCFVGRYALPCYERGFEHLLLYPYHWDSPSLGERVYLKFAINTVVTPDGKIHHYYHLDCHEDQRN